MIEVNNQTSYSIEEQFFKKIINTVLKEEGVEGLYISLALVEKDKMKKLNRI